MFNLISETLQTVKDDYVSPAFDGAVQIMNHYPKTTTLVLAAALPGSFLYVGVPTLIAGSSAVGALTINDLKSKGFTIEDGAKICKGLPTSLSSGSFLHGAASSGNLKMMEYFLAHGVDINQLDTDGMTPLHAAVRTGQQDSVDFLISAGAEIKEMPYSLVHVAVISNQVTMIKYLLDQVKVDVNVSNTLGQTPLHYAISFGGAEVINLLCEYGADVNAKDHNCETPLHIASRHSSAEVFITLLEQGADWRAVNKTNETPIELLKNEADAKVVDQVQAFIESISHHG